jgi:anti-anti-sigma regulatory factor
VFHIGPAVALHGDPQVTGKSSQIEVTVVGGAAVVRFRRTECLMVSIDPGQDVGEELFTLVDNDHHSVVVLDFGTPDIHWLSGAVQALLVTLHHRLFKANGVLRLCNVPEPIMKQFQVNQLVKVFNIYPNLEAALKSDA